MHVIEIFLSKCHHLAIVLTRLFYVGYAASVKMIFDLL